MPGHRSATDEYGHDCDVSFEGGADFNSMRSFGSEKARLSSVVLRAQPARRNDHHHDPRHQQCGCDLFYEVTPRLEGTDVPEDLGLPRSSTTPS